jgi:hypothetical protein
VDAYLQTPMNLDNSGSCHSVFSHPQVPRATVGRERRDRDQSLDSAQHAGSDAPSPTLLGAESFLWTLSAYLAHVEKLHDPHLGDLWAQSQMTYHSLRNENQEPATEHVLERKDDCLHRSWYLDA